MDISERIGEFGVFVFEPVSVSVLRHASDVKHAALVVMVVTAITTDSSSIVESGTAMLDIVPNSELVHGSRVDGAVNEGLTKGSCCTVRLKNPSKSVKVITVPFGFPDCSSGRRSRSEFPKLR